jgi:hypothetical protein
MGQHVFISYSRRDIDFATEIAASIKDAKFKVWMDRQEINGGAKWRDHIKNGLTRANEVVVILSPNSVVSSWVNHEVSMAIGMGKPVYPICIQPVEKLPVWAEDIQIIDFISGNHEKGLKELIEALTPHNPLQDLLDSQVSAYHTYGSTISSSLLKVFDEERHNLSIDGNAQKALDESKKRHQAANQSVNILTAIAIVPISVFALWWGKNKSWKKWVESRRNNASIGTKES